MGFSIHLITFLLHILLKLNKYDVAENVNVNDNDTVITATVEMNNKLVDALF